MFYGLWLIVLGALAVPSLVIAKRPEAKDLIAKITPYQGWIGAISAIGGLFGLIFWVILRIPLYLSLGLHGIIWLATIGGTEFIQFALGLLLGVGTLKTFIKNPQANEKMDQTIAKLSPHQGRLGIAAIALGIWTIVASFIFL